jgi:carboxypeptidase Taq
VAEGLEAGDYAPLRHWLNREIHRHGRSRTPADLLRGATGAELEIGAYVADLTAKVAALEAA